METPNRGAPTPAIGFDTALSSVRDRFAGMSVAVDDKVVARLRDACAVVSLDGDAAVDESRDWWPLAMAWSLDGVGPGRAGVIVRPGSADEVAGVLEVCNDAGVPVTPAAGRSGVCGAAIPVFGGVLLDLCGLEGIVDVDATSLVLDVLPGTFGDVLEDELRASHGVTLGHWPQSIALSTVGGWLACRSAGQYSNRYGKIEDMVVGLDLVLADGRRLSTGGAPRAATGPDLTQLFVGSEGTLGVITGARLRVHPVPVATWSAAFGYASFADGLEACRVLIQRGVTPAVLRLYDAAEAKRNFSVDTAVLLVSDEADPVIVAATRAAVEESFGGADRLDDALVDHWFGHRNDVAALEALTRRGIVVDTIEIAGRWAALPGIYDAATDAILSVEGALVATAHQSHAYNDGACLYFTFAGQVGEDIEAKERFYRAAWDAATQAVLARGGALSHHHGVGLNRGRFLRDALGGGFDVLASVKQALDPKGILNPGKLGLPSPFGAPPWP